jgi:hypothetical protein
MIDRKPEITTAKWVTEGLARAFGVCVSLREDDMNLTEKRIEQRLIEDGQHNIDYQNEELIKAEKEAEAISKRTEEEWQTLYVADEKEKVEGNTKRTIEAQAMKARHTQVQKDLEKVLESNVHTITKDIVKFGIDQLKLTEDETEPYIQEPVTLQKFIAETKKANAWSLSYHEEELAKATKRAKERLKLYRQLKKDINAVLFISKQEEGKTQ